MSHTCPRLNLAAPAAIRDLVMHSFPLPLPPHKSTLSSLTFITEWYVNICLYDYFTDFYFPQ